MLLKLVARLFIYFFFRRLIIRGSKPKHEGAIIWVANHQSAITDPCLLLVIASKSPRPIAKHTLWDHPVMIYFLKWVRALPVVRRQDLEKGQKEEWMKKKNEEAFNKVSEALYQGDHLMIFPEGVSHNEPRLLPLKNGFARMAVQSLEKYRNPDFKILIQPIVIAYENRDEFQSNVYTFLKKPLLIDNPEIPIEQIMSHVEHELKENLPSFLSWDEKRNWDFIYKIVIEPNCPQFAHMSEFVEKHKSAMPPESFIMQKVQSLRRLSLGLGLSPQTIAWAIHNRDGLAYSRFLFKYTIPFLLLFLPGQVASLIVWSIPYALISKLAKIGEPDDSIISTMKIAHGAYIMPIWSLLVSFGFVWYVNWSFWTELIIGSTIFLGAPFLILMSHWSGENVKMYRGVLRLASLKVFFPRAWEELHREIDDVFHQLSDIFADSCPLGKGELTRK